MLSRLHFAACKAAVSRPTLKDWTRPIAAIRLIHGTGLYAGGTGRLK
jgi:hypothetical protein